MFTPSSLKYRPCLNNKYSFNLCEKTSEILHRTIFVISKSNASLKDNIQFAIWSWW